MDLSSYFKKKKVTICNFVTKIKILTNYCFFNIASSSALPGNIIHVIPSAPDKEHHLEAILSVKN